MFDWRMGEGCWRQQLFRQKREPSSSIYLQGRPSYYHCLMHLSWLFPTCCFIEVFSTTKVICTSGSDSPCKKDSKRRSSFTKYHWLAISDSLFPGLTGLCGFWGNKTAVMPEKRLQLWRSQNYCFKFGHALLNPFLRLEKKYSMSFWTYITL